MVYCVLVKLMVLFKRLILKGLKVMQVLKEQIVGDLLNFYL